MFYLEEQSRAEKETGTMELHRYETDVKLGLNFTDNGNRYEI